MSPWRKLPLVKKFDISKILFYSVAAVALVGAIFGFGLYSGARKTSVFNAVRDFTAAIAEAVQLTSDEATTLTRTVPQHFLQPSRLEGSGVTFNDPSSNQDDLILLSGFFEDGNQLRLIRRNGTLVAHWPVAFSALFTNTDHIRDRAPPATDWNIDTHGALAMPDGSVVFNFEYGGSVRLDRCGETLWTVKAQSHHSIERAEGGGFWAPGRRFHGAGEASPFPPFVTPLSEDTLLRLSDRGEVLAEISLPEILYDAGLEALLTTSRNTDGTRMVWHGEILHLNKIDELSSDEASHFPQFAAGDLLLSIRNLNLLVVVDPLGKEVKWWQVGPWLRQHDAEFTANGKIILFNNNSYRPPTAPPAGPGSGAERDSNILEVDPSSAEHRVLYPGSVSEPFRSVIRGKQQVTPTGGLLITEFEGGRVFEVDLEGRKVWEYINRYDADRVAEITEARIYKSSYFAKSEWSCEG